MSMTAVDVRFARRLARADDGLSRLRAVDNVAVAAMSLTGAALTVVDVSGVVVVAVVAVVVLTSAAASSAVAEVVVDVAVVAVVAIVAVVVMPAVGCVSSSA